MAKKYDLIIIGGGPAGITAGIYATRFNLKTLIVERLGIGGQINYTETVDNYPGFSEISSQELVQKFEAHAKKLGVEILYDDVIELDVDKPEKKIVTESSGELSARSVILSTGARPRMLNVDREEEFVGRGICFCALCDGGFYVDKDVIVVGGGNVAFEEALLLSRTAKSVTLVHILKNFQANATLVEKLKNNPKIKYVLESQVVRLIGENKIEAIEIKNVETNVVDTIKTDGVFVSIGRIPNTELFKSIDVDNNGYCIVDEDLKTNVDGVYAIGDIRQKKVRQIITACSDGAIAATSVANYLN